MSGTLIAAFDTESTGLDFARDHVVQLATVLYDAADPRNQMTFNALANPGRPIPPDASKVHGITDEQVRYAPDPASVAKDWWNELVEIARVQGKQLILCAHNADFDLRMLRKYFGPGWPGVPVICTFRLSRRIDPDSPLHKLGHLVAERYQLDSELVKRAHDALADCHMCGILLEYYVHKSGKGHQELAEWLENPVELGTMPFGKFKGLRFKEVRPGYLKWLSEQEGMDPDVVLSARMALGR